MKMSTSNKEKKQYRAIGHKLKPVVIISNGLSDNVNAEISRALEDHELIKLKINVPDYNEKKQMLLNICDSNNAELIQLVGNIALIFRAGVKPSPKLSNLIRHQSLFPENH